MRSENCLAALRQQELEPKKIVLISTTGVYGDTQGEWVTEEKKPNPSSDRARRRLSAERQWQSYSQERGVPLVVLRVPGIYSFDRIPIDRLQKATPVVRASEVGFSNRIHADDLAMLAVAAMLKGECGGRLQRFRWRTKLDYGILKGGSESCRAASTPRK